MRIIAYLLYGSRREYAFELTYSVLSAMHFLGEGSSCRIVLITDEAHKRPDLPVEHLIFSPEEFHDWTRGGTYLHRAKVHAMTKAMDHYQCPTALVDTDTYFLDHPEKLFERVSAGKSVLHRFEGYLGNREKFDYWSPLLERVTGPIAGYRVDGGSLMFNSGVAGLDFTDRHLLDDIVRLTDGLYAICPIFNIEQFAFSTVLNQHTQTTCCENLVHHYFGHERGFFHSQIGRLFPTFSRELFNRYVDELPRLGYPRKRPSDLLKARFISLIRRESEHYRFAYLAYLCALRKSKTDAAEARVWARITPDVLRRHRFPAEHIKSDFNKMQHALEYDWLDSDTRQDWNRFWESVADRHH